MKLSHGLNLLLAIALLCVTVLWISRTPHSSSTEISMQDSIINNVMTRTSIRAYTSAMAAPSAVNKQPWHFIVVNQPSMLQAIADACPNASMAQHAPLAIVVCGDMSKALEGEARDYWIQDASAATENILLAAHAIGLGAVWTGIYPISERCASVASLLSLPEHIVPLCTIVVGHPAQHPAPKDKFQPSNISYNTYGNRDAAVQHFDVPERVLKPFDMAAEFRDNPFRMLSGDGLLLAAGNDVKSNAMTIGWGAFGRLWGKDMVTVYVAGKRFTKTLLDSNDYFCVMQFDRSHAHVLDYMGHHSGRDGDKAAALGLHTAYTPNGTPYYEEASLVVECRLMYSDTFRSEGMREVPKALYDGYQSGVHTQYVGEIVGAWKK